MTPKIKSTVHKVFEELNQAIADENKERSEAGTLTIPKCEVKILGQMSLLVNERVSAILHLAQTGDMDALLTKNSFLETSLKKILANYGFKYDEDSEKIWLPPGSNFEQIFSFDHVVVKILDPESALVSKAVKAPAKNKMLIREAIASGKFGGLVDRIIKNGQKLEVFL